MEAAMGLMRRIHPKQSETALSALLSLLPHSSSDLLSQVDQPLQKSTSYSTPTTEGTPSQGSVTGSGLGYAGSGSDTGYGAGSGGATMLADGSWLAGLAMGDSFKTASPSALQSTMVAFTTSLVIIVSFIFFHAANLCCTGILVLG